MSDDPQRVHVAGEPRRSFAQGRRIVQPCSRCGILLAQHDLDNPPMVMVEPGEKPTPIAWFGVGDQYGRDPGYPDGGVTMTWLLDDDEIARDGLALCDADEVPAGVERLVGAG